MPTILVNGRLFHRNPRPDEYQIGFDNLTGCLVVVVNSHELFCVDGEGARALAIAMVQYFCDAPSK